ncbi:MAG: DNA polymerase domain-containing protein [Candidatus Promineifilaceae bacterium]
MAEYYGWLLDVYPDEEKGLVLWFIGEDEKRYCFHQPFPVIFFIAGPFPRLREAWRYLRAHPAAANLSRRKRRDLFSGLLDVLAVEVCNPALQPKVFQDTMHRFPDLDFYDADVPLALRYAAAFDVFPLAYCRIVVDDSNQIEAIYSLDSRWEVDSVRPVLRILAVEPNVDPTHAEPVSLCLKSGRHSYTISLKPFRQLLIHFQASLKRFDPDILLTNWGDTWLFPYLVEAWKSEEAAYFNPNRHESRWILQRKENSYFTYGQVVYRGQQTHLYGRWHIDQRNAMMYGEYGLEGVLEQARVTGLPVQEIARKSPGAGITAMQMQTALQNEILIPYQKQQAEWFKRATDLLRSDRGGMVYQPLIGLHEDVAEIDFVSMYPGIMVRFNISPETVGVKQQGCEMVPELGVPVDQSQEGLVPKTLRPLLQKRFVIKQRLAGMSRRDCRYEPLKARSAALKWLLVVCFGYLGYKNARFGRIESHEAVTAYGREALLRAKETAEDADFVVLHMYVDGLWVKRKQGQTADFIEPLLAEIMARTGLPIALEGIYRWIAFLPSRLDKRVPVANRYFGLFQDGVLKKRGIEVQRHDTPFFVAQVQEKILRRMAAVPPGQPLQSCLPAVLRMLSKSLSDLQAGKIPPHYLVVSQTLSKTVDEYRVPSPAARAAMQLERAGKERRPGQRIKFIYTYGEPGVYAWDLFQPLNPQSIDTNCYKDLMIRAAAAVLQPLDIEENELRSWLLGYGFQTRFYLIPSTNALCLDRPDPYTTIDSHESA